MGWGAGGLGLQTVAEQSGWSFRHPAAAPRGCGAAGCGAAANENADEVADEAEDEEEGEDGFGEG